MHRENRFVSRAARLALPALTLLVGLALIPAVSLAERPLSLNQAAFVEGSDSYRFGHRSIATLPIEGLPLDADLSRWAMAHDGRVYRLYFMKAGTDDTLYQLGYAPSKKRYVFGHNSMPQIKIHGIPDNADTSSFAMLHDGQNFRLYFLSHDRSRRLHQFAFNPQTRRYEHGFRSIPQLGIRGTPSDADWNRWGMLHDGQQYRLYCGKKNTVDALYQHAFHHGSQQYRHGYQSISSMRLEGAPKDSMFGSFAMLHDGSDYRVYLKNP